MVTSHSGRGPLVVDGKDYLLIDRCTLHRPEVGSLSAIDGIPQATWSSTTTTKHSDSRSLGITSLLRSFSCAFNLTSREVLRSRICQTGARSLHPFSITTYSETSYIVGDGQNAFQAGNQITRLEWCWGVFAACGGLILIEVCFLGQS